MPSVLRHCHNSVLWSSSGTSILHPLTVSSPQYYDTVTTQCSEAPVVHLYYTLSQCHHLSITTLSQLSALNSWQCCLPSVLQHSWLGNRKGKNVGCWYVGGDDLTGALYVLQLQEVVANTSFILSCNKIQNGDILLPAYRGPPGKWP